MERRLGVQITDAPPRKPDGIFRPIIIEPIPYRPDEILSKELIDRLYKAHYDNDVEYAKEVAEKTPITYLQDERGLIFTFNHYDVRQDGMDNLRDFEEMLKPVELRKRPFNRQFPNIYKAIRKIEEKDDVALRALITHVCGFKFLHLKNGNGPMCFSKPLGYDRVKNAEALEKQIESGTL
jgi:hypothetical protein